MTQVQLTYHKARRQWRKKRKIDGKDRYFYLGRSGVNKTDREAYEEALRDWERIEGQLVTRQAKQDQQAERNRLDKIRDEHADALEAVEGARQDPTNRVQRLLAEAIVISHGVQDHPDFRLPGSDGPQTIKAHIERFLSGFDTKVKLDDRSHARRSALRAHLYRFRDWRPDQGSTTGDRPISEICAAMLAEFHDGLSNQLADKAISAYTARDALGAVRQFIRWAWERELCGLPRNIDSRNLTFTVPAKTVDVWEIDEVQRLLDAASDRMRLYLLLALNCGMTQRDLADLRRDEVDIKAGTITRKRSKTHKHAGVPVVTYQLWPATKKLLKTFAQTSGDLALLTENGEPLVREWTGDDGSPAKVDTVRLAFRRLLEKVNKLVNGEAEHKHVRIDGSFKLLRATGANLLEQENGFKAVVTLYLGHAPTTIAERHYTRGDQGLLDKAVAWLGQQFR
jgi:integrase